MPIITTALGSRDPFLCSWSSWSNVILDIDGSSVRFPMPVTHKNPLGVCFLSGYGPRCSSRRMLTFSIQDNFNRFTRETTTISGENGHPLKQMARSSSIILYSISTFHQEIKDSQSRGGEENWTHRGASAPSAVQMSCARNSTLISLLYICHLLMSNLRKRGLTLLQL